VCEVDLKSTLRDQIQETQRYDHELQKLKKQDDSVDGDGMILFRNRVCVPNDARIKKTVLEENLSSQYLVPGATKMYQYMKKLFWWPGMKKEIAEFVYKCLTGLKIKVEHQRPSGPLQPI
jgi:hypothetical protein